MPLSLVSEVVAHGGFLPQLAVLQEKKTLWNKKNGVIATIMFVITFMMLLPALLGVADLDNAAGVSAIFGVFGGMMMLIGSLAFLPSSKPKYNFPTNAPPQMPAPGLYNAPQQQQQQQNALPPQMSQPVNQYRPGAGSWRDTNDLQPSVTESTTRLLNDDEGHR